MQLNVPAGKELHQCQYVALPANSDINVVGISHKYTTGSHHFLVYSTDLDTIPDDMRGQYDCVNGDEPIMQHATGPLYGAQSAAGSIRFPDGVGVVMKARQVMMLQTHYINSTSADIYATVSAGFDTAPADQIRERAGFMLFYDPFIYVPAHSSATSAIRCPVPSDVTIISAFTHYHRFGTGMRVWIDPDMSSESKAPFYQTNDWEHPPDFHGPLPVRAGSAFRLECSYTNSGSEEIFQGPNAATSEMCVLAGLYYPQVSNEFAYCSDVSIVGTGNKTCNDVLSCVRECPIGDAPRFTNGGVIVGPCWERCIASGCAGATDAVLPVSVCVGRECSAECSAGADACATCATTQCTAQVAACFAHKCGG
jgi:Copper type II ascorbate-dependent monooxygenase, C-terminal domain